MSRRHANVCFHGIGTPERDLEPGEDRYWITRDSFLRFLDAMLGRTDVRISFDDGNLSDIEIGLPALLERGLPATFFVLAGRLEQRGSLAPEHVRELAANGMAIGTHGMNHRPWRGLEPAERDRELVEAQQRLADVVGTGVDQAALPLGRYDRRLLGDLRGLGYTKVFSSDRRWARADAWLQPRFSARAEDTVATLRDDILARPGSLREVPGAVKGILKRLR